LVRLVVHQVLLDLLSLGVVILGQYILLAFPLVELVLAELVEDRVVMVGNPQSLVRLAVLVATQAMEAMRVTSIIQRVLLFLLTLLLARVEAVAEVLNVVALERAHLAVVEVLGYLVRGLMARLV
jgi:hypothetical protein